MLSNQFAGVCDNPDYETNIRDSLNIVDYCAKSDPQADRIHFVIKSFRAVVLGRTEASKPKKREKPSSRAKISRTAGPREPPQAQSSVFYNYGEKSRNGLDSPQSTPNHSSTITSHVLQAPLNPLVVPPNGFMGGTSKSMTSALMVSPESIHTPLSQIQVESSVRQGNESAGSDPVGGEAEFHFDRFWGLPTNVPLHVDTQLQSPSHVHPMHAAGSGHGNLGHGHFHFDMTHGQVNGVLMDPRLSLYQQGTFPQTEERR